MAHLSPGPAARKLQTAQWIIVALLFAFSVISYFDRTIMSIAGPQMMKDFGLSPTEMGSVYSAFILGYALFMIPCGHLTDRLGARRTLGLMGLFSAAFTLLVMLSGKPGLGAYVGIVPALFAIRLGMGVVTAPLYPACAKMTANWIPVVYHGRVQGFIIAGSALGAATSPLLFTWMLMQFGWRASFALAALGTAFLGMAWLWYARDYPPGARLAEPAGCKQASRASWAKLFANRNLMLLTFAYGALGYYQYIFFYWIYYYFGEVLHLGAQASAKYTTILFLVEGAIMPLGGLVSDRLTRIYGPQFGRRLVPIVGLTLSAIFTYAGTVSSGIVAVVALLSLAFGLAACCEGPFWASVTEMAGEHVGGASSILNAGAQVGGVFAPILTPYIAARAGWSWGLYAGSLFALSGVVAIYFADVRPGVIADRPGLGSQHPPVAVP
jgi:ACS family glucarate transporter-like MFS transporter